MRAAIPRRTPALCARHRRAGAGFTLIEVGIALALLAMTAMFVIPELNQITDANVKSQALQLVGVIEHANTQAVTRRNRYQLRMDLDKHTYSLWAYHSGKGKFVPAPSAMVGKEQKLEEGVVFKDVFVAGKLYKKGLTYFEFQPDGTTDEGMIHLASLNDDEYTVEVDYYMATGEVFPGYTTPEEFTAVQTERGK